MGWDVNLSGGCLLSNRSHGLIKLFSIIIFEFLINYVRLRRVRRWYVLYEEEATDKKGQQAGHLHSI